MRARALVPAALLVGALAMASVAGGETGALSDPVCLSGESESSPPCSPAPQAFSAGVSSGFDRVQAVDVSPDGTSVYAVSQGDDAIVEIDRDPGTNALSFAGCISGETNSTIDACAPAPTTAAAGVDTGFDELADVAVSPDGEWVYAVSQSDDAVLRFDRAPATGALTFVDCVSAETTTASGACDPAATGTSASGASTGLDSPSGIAVAPRLNGFSLYVTTQNDDSVMRLNHDTVGDTLAAVDCISSELASASSGGGPCDDAGTVAANGSATGFDQTFSPVVSDDGDNVYVGSNGDAAVAWLDRGALGGLSWNDCITGETGTGPAPSGNDACGVALPSATASGANSGLERAQSVVLPPGGGDVYVGSQTDSAVYGFERNASGDLIISGCLSGEEQIAVGQCSLIPTSTTFGHESGLEAVQSIAVSPDGKSLYAAAAGDDAIATFDRDLANGELDWDGCVTGETETGPAPGGSGACRAVAAQTDGLDSGLDLIRSIAVSPDGLQVIGGAEDDDSVIGATRSNAPETNLVSGPPALTNDPTATFVFAADETPAGFQCRVDAGAFGPCSGAVSHTTAALPDGLHTFRVRAANDATPAGVDPTPAIQPFTVDTTAPDSAITSGPTGTIAESSAAFGFEAAGADGFECRLDAAAFAPCTSPRTLTGLGDGSHSFEVRAEDAAGNVEGSPAARSFAVDTTAPDTDLSKKPKKKVRTKRKKVKASFRFSGAGSDGSYECRRDRGEDFKPCHSPYKRKYKRGKHTFKVRAIDAVGNVDGSAAVHIWRVKRK